MNRRDFLVVGASSAALAAAAGRSSDSALAAEDVLGVPTLACDPRQTKLNVKPVMTNIVHSDAWEGPCRWQSIPPDQEKRAAEASFAAWCKQLREGFLGRSRLVNLLEPVQITFAECFTVTPDQLAKLAPDRQATDAALVYPAGSSISGYEVARYLGKPIVMIGLNCRNVDIATYTRAKGLEAFVARDQADFQQLVGLLQARKVLRSTKVLFPTDRGLPASCSVGSIWDLEDLHRRLGVEVKTISYQELAGEMKTVLESEPLAAAAQRAAEQLVQKADKSFLDIKYVVRSVQFYQAVKNLMVRHGCNAFTIECFEFCSSRWPEKWTITPCLLHALFGNQRCASSCEADLGTLLALRMLMSVSGKSCHQGNCDPRAEDTFRINHSAPSMKMNGFDQPDLPYQLGRFVSGGWGTKVVVNFMENAEKTVTVARVNPLATKLLVLRGRLVGASGWGQDLLSCSVEAVIRPPEGRCDDFMRKRLEYGNHQSWVYGDYVEPLRRLGEMLGLTVEVIA